MENNYGMILIWLFPLLGGIVGFYVGKKNKQFRNDVIDIVFFVEWIMLACMGYEIWKKWSTLEVQLQGVLESIWIFKMDVVRLLMCCVATIVFSVVSQYMKESMKKEKGSNRFYLLFMCVYSMLMASLLSAFIPQICKFLSVALLFMYPMIMHRQERIAVRNAGVFLVFAMTSIILITIGCAANADFILGPYLLDTQKSEISILLIGVVFSLAFILYCGICPVQFLVTRGASNGLLEGSVLVSAVISKIGIFGMLMTVPLITTSVKYIGNVLIILLVILAITTIVWGLLLTFTATDIRKILVGLNVAINGFNVLGVSLVLLCEEMNYETIRGCMYMLISSALSLVVLYMAGLEMVRKKETYEIKGLIASGKGKKLLMAGCFFACANLLGLPGTMGYFGFATFFHVIAYGLGWKWLTALYVLMWAFLFTAVSRVFMKLFISKKDKTVLILSTADEVKKSEEEEEEDTDLITFEIEKEWNQNPYRIGHVWLVLVGIIQVIVGLVPKHTVEIIGNQIDLFFNNNTMENAGSYYELPELMAFLVVAILGIILYVNLVHGVLLRAIRNKKNKMLKDMQENQQ